MAPAIGEEGGVVGGVRRSEGVVLVVLVELGGDCGDRGDGDGSLVSCSSCERRSSWGVTVPAVPGRREDVREVSEEVAVRVE